MSYRVQYSDHARDSVRKMGSGRRARFDQRMARLAQDPYGHGRASDSRDRRQAEAAGVVVVYWISRNVLTVSVVTVVHTD